MSTRLARIVLVVAAAMLTSRTEARTLDVFPGAGTPVQDAIDGSLPGDTVRLNVGAYPESVVLDRGIKLVGRAGAILEAGCDRPAAIDIRADRVATDIGTGDGYADTVFYVDSIAQDARVRLMRVSTNLPNGRGIAVVDSTGVLFDHFAVLVTHSDVANADTGILRSGTEGIDVNHNGVTTSTAVGIDVDSGSDRNSLKANVADANALDARDQGGNNRWVANVYDTGSVPRCPP